MTICINSIIISKHIACRYIDVNCANNNCVLILYIKIVILAAQGSCFPAASISLYQSSHFFAANVSGSQRATSLFSGYIHVNVSLVNHCVFSNCVFSLIKMAIFFITLTLSQAISAKLGLILETVDTK